MSVRVCVCVCVCLVLQLSLLESHSAPIRVAIQVTVMASYGIIFLGRNLTHDCFSRLRSINDILVIDWGWTRPLAWQNNILQETVCVAPLVSSLRAVP